jgi:predicted amidophosphoribosyltransferase
LVWCRSYLAYDGHCTDLVARLKYRNARSSVGWLAEGMASLVVEPVDLVTWAPTTPPRRRERGFDQAEVLARAVARRLRVPSRRLLRRRPGPHQTGRSLAERRSGVTFEAVNRRVEGRVGSVLVVDDVVTSGSTLVAAASALRSGGVRSVAGLAAAHTP